MSDKPRQHPQPGQGSSSAAAKSAAPAAPTESAAGRMRLAKFLANAGIASRRRCEQLIAEGRVTVNDKAVLTPVCLVDPERDIVRFEGRPLQMAKKVCLLLHKPAGYTCSAQDEHAERLVYELLPERFGRVYSVGRLDRDSEGLLLLTNEGELAHRLSHPSHEVEKRYIAECNGVFQPEMLKIFLDGCVDEGEFLRAQSVSVKQQRPTQVTLAIVLTEGKKRELRRLCRQAGLEVVRLIRTGFANLELGALPPGQWRELSSTERDALRQIVRQPAAGRD
ncbi:MAG: rRNA pseudouridine synthase [Lentisphaerae bacterium]|nr:rRNA pseudouridine synthase [Lentisphaerota bacterium]